LIHYVYFYSKNRAVTKKQQSRLFNNVYRNLFKSTTESKDKNLNYVPVSYVILRKGKA
jgi:hypothetical protein